MKRIVLGACAALALSGCSSLKVAEVDASTGHLDAYATAAVVKNQPFDLDSRKALLLAPNGDFTKGQVENLHYFDRVVVLSDIESGIIKENLGDKVPSVRDRIGINNAAKFYKPFLWLRVDAHGSNRNSQFAQLILTDPLTMDDIFVAEVHLDYVWAGVNDQNTWYPLFNALIDYIAANSKTYKPATPAAAAPH